VNARFLNSVELCKFNLLEVLYVRHTTLDSFIKILSLLPFIKKCLVEKQQGIWYELVKR